MPNTPRRSIGRRIVLFLAALAPLGLYVLTGLIAAALVMAPRMIEATRASMAATPDMQLEIVTSTPAEHVEWALIEAALPDGARDVHLSDDLRSLRFSIAFDPAAEDGWRVLAKRQAEFGPNRFVLRAAAAEAGAPAPPAKAPSLPSMSEADKAHIFVLSAILHLPAIALLCWAFRRRLDAAPAFSWRSAMRWALAALAGIYAVNIPLSSLLPPDAASTERYLDAYRPLFTALSPWAAALLMIGIAPLIEELTFRKWMLSLLPRAVGNVAAVLLGCALFIAIHMPQSVWHVLMLATPSLAFALLWMKSRSLLLCWLTHAAMNAIAFLALSQQM